MTTRRQRLAALRNILGPEAVELALQFLPNRERETEAEAIIRARDETERTATALAMRDTRDAVLAGRYGKPAQLKAREKVMAFGRDHETTLKFCSELANKVRKSEHYKHLAIERKKAL